MRNREQNEMGIRSNGGSVSSVIVFATSEVEEQVERLIVFHVRVKILKNMKK